MFALRPVLEPRIAVGREILLSAIGPAPVMTASINLEPVVLRPRTFGTEMPFTGMHRRVTGRPERLGQSRVIGRQSLEIGRRPEPTLPMIDPAQLEATIASRFVTIGDAVRETVGRAEVIRVAGARRVLPGHDG